MVDVSTTPAKWSIVWWLYSCYLQPSTPILRHQSTVHNQTNHHLELDHNLFSLCWLMLALPSLILLYIKLLSAGQFIFTFTGPPCNQFPLLLLPNPLWRAAKNTSKIWHTLIPPPPLLTQHCVSYIYICIHVCVCVCICMHVSVYLHTYAIHIGNLTWP